MWLDDKQQAELEAKIGLDKKPALSDADGVERYVAMTIGLAGVYMMENIRYHVNRVATALCEMQGKEPRAALEKATGLIEAACQMAFEEALSDKPATPDKSFNSVAYAMKKKQKPLQLVRIELNDKSCVLAVANAEDKILTAGGFIDKHTAETAATMLETLLARLDMLGGTQKLPPMINFEELLKLCDKAMEDTQNLADMF